MSTGLFPDKDTVVCVSLAARPSNLGMTVHNAAYRALRLNYLYKAFAISDLPAALAGVRAFGIRGCSVSMPFKEVAVGLVDVLDSTAASIGAINTIVNAGGRLTGYNTDAYAASVVLSRLGLSRTAAVLVLGAGGAARAVFHALRALDFVNMALSTRSTKRLASWTELPSCTVVPWSARNAYPAELVINATPIGMAPDVNEMPLAATAVDRAHAVMDLVSTPRETALVHAARAAGAVVISGAEMGLYQAARQFEMYTGCNAPLDVMKAALDDFDSRS